MCFRKNGEVKAKKYEILCNEIWNFVFCIPIDLAK